MAESPNLKDYRWIVVNSSGGKDSQTALRCVVERCDLLGIARDRIVVSHQDLGRVEWQGTQELVRQQAAVYGLRVEISRYRNKAGAEIGLLDYVRNRGKWMSPGVRFCTSEFKRSPGERVCRMLFKESPGAILNVKGIRGDESPARAKLVPFCVNERMTTESRLVHDWLPIFSWTSKQVWDDITLSQVPHHKAYDLGMPRLSCAFCIYAPKSVLMIAGKHNPELLDEYVALEKEIGHTFQNGRSIASIKEAIAAGEEAGPVNDWIM